MALAMMRAPGMDWGASPKRWVTGSPGVGWWISGVLSWLSGGRFSWRSERDHVVVSGLAAGAAPVDGAEAEDAALGGAQAVAGGGGGGDVVDLQPPGYGGGGEV